MAKIDPSDVMRGWYSEHEPSWRQESITTQLKLPDDFAPNKAGVTFETPTHVASLFVWGTGTLELIVLDLATRKEVLLGNKEYTTVQELREQLNASAHLFEQIVREARDGENPASVGQDDNPAFLERTTMSKFWVLEEPDDPDASRREAKWNNSAELRYESIRCAINPGHRRAGARLSPVNVILPNITPYDFVWGLWTCLVQEPVLALFRDAGFRGYDAATAIVRFSRESEQPPKFWELLAMGSAGRPSAESGSKVISTCPGCDLTYYSRIEDPTKLVDEARWDGSDFFRVELFPSRIFVTDRVVKALRESPFKGWEVYSLAEMKDKFDISVPGPSPEERSALN